jgi:hypothetical protein
MRSVIGRAEITRARSEKLSAATAVPAVQIAAMASASFFMVPASSMSLGAEGFPAAKRGRRRSG